MAMVSHGYGNISDMYLRQSDLCLLERVLFTSCYCILLVIKEGILKN